VAASFIVNTIELVRRAVSDLRDAGFTVAVFGGWAEELLGVCAPRIHKDIEY
jgi:hypothetical protein